MLEPSEIFAGQQLLGRSLRLATSPAITCTNGMPLSRLHPAMCDDPACLSNGLSPAPWPPGWQAGQLHAATVVGQDCRRWVPYSAQQVPQLKSQQLPVDSDNTACMVLGRPAPDVQSRHAGQAVVVP